MNIKEYIESGILEAYALGALSREEAVEVETTVARYPELEAELRSVEAAMEQYAMANATTPPPALQDKIWNSIQAQGPVKEAAAEPQKPRSATMPFEPEYRRAPKWRYAAIWAALIGSTVLNIVLFTQGKKARENELALGNEMRDMRVQQQQLAQAVEAYAKAKDMMADTAMQTIVMHTVVKGHPMAATMYWGKGDGAAYVAMNALPKPPQGKQYQLWVIQNGKPVSMGVLPSDMANTPGVKKVDMTVMQAEAFAISLEVEGGNATPTEVYVMGKA